jgi:penicillin-binding protein 1C
VNAPRGVNAVRALSFGGKLLKSSVGTAFGLASLGCVFIAIVVVMLSIPADIADFADVKANWRSSEAWVLDRNGAVIDHRRLDYTVRRLEWTPFESISPALVSAVIAGEDRRFWEHDGIDWIALVPAMSSQVSGERRRGASTITMQVAKLLQYSATGGKLQRTVRRKLTEMRLARTLESRWTKRQILEVYFNIAMFRRELQGVDAASRILAGKTPSGLSVTESTVLAALLVSPSAGPDFVIQRACARAVAQKNTVTCDEIRERALVMLDQYNQPTAETVAGPRLAPHLASSLLTKAGERVRTTLDARVQTMATEVLRTHLAGLADRNVRDGAVLIVDNESGDVLAYVGSAAQTSRSREVDGVRARRQAGSTLKPFLYGLAIERGYLTAASLLDDSPIALDTASGVYLPQNYDKDFKGLVSVRTALGSSLNVPAVRTLVLTGVEPFRDRLHEMGYEGITQTGEFYGYALALGAPEVSLWEQVRAYRALARGGRSGQIRVRSDATGRVDAGRTREVRFDGADEKNARPAAVMSASAAFVVSDVMSDRAARTVTFGLDNYLNTPFWSAVKTGTSKDMRDNWCIGFSRTFTIGVWVGNFEGDSMHDVSGVTGAAPVWNQLMIALQGNTPSPAPEIPDGVVASNARFTPSVEAPRKELFLRTAALEGATGTTADATIAAISTGGEIAHIASPSNGMVIAIDPDIPETFQRVPLTASGVNEGMVLKLNGTVLGKATGKVLWSPKRGTHLLALEDASGRTIDRAHFIVR